MKRSRRIQLVLITAALASCHRAFLPQQSTIRNPVDPALTAAPADEGDPGAGTFNLCCQEAYAALWNYSFNFTGSGYIPPPGQGYYYPGGGYRKGSFWRSDHFILRGGWGKSGGSASS